MGQTVPELSLPKTEEIERVEISPASMINWYQPGELLELLPKFVLSEGTYLDKQSFQRGTFTLKTGKKINWLANSAESILLFDGINERLYKLPNADMPLFKIWDAAGRENFMDASGKILWKIWRRSVGEFSEGLVPVLVGDKWGYANLAGEIVIRPRWKVLSHGFVPPIGRFSEGLAAVIEEKELRQGRLINSNYAVYKCGYIKKRKQNAWETILPPPALCIFRRTRDNQ